jgi:hypothetical protein
MLLRLPPAQEIKDKNDKGSHNQQVNQSSGYAQGESQKPENEQNGNDSSEHLSFLFGWGTKNNLKRNHSSGLSIFHFLFFGLDLNPLVLNVEPEPVVDAHIQIRYPHQGK